MILGVPLFLLFCVYGVVNTYLPVLLSGLGYSITQIGLLQGLFEAAGLIFPVVVSSRVDKRGNYGMANILLALCIVAVLPPLVAFRQFRVSAVLLMILAVGYKGTVPLVDTMVTRRLGKGNTNYGTIRVMGSIGFVCITLLFQFTRVLNPDSLVSIAGWIALPSLLFILSLLCIPGLMKRLPRDDEDGVPAVIAGGGVTAEGKVVASETGQILGRDGRIPTLMRSFPRSYWAGLFLMFLGFFGMTPSQKFFSLYVRDFLGLESYAGLWALSAAAEVPFMFLSGIFIRKYGTKNILLFSLLAITSRNLVYAFFPTFGGAVVGQLFHSVCFGLFHPAAIVFVSERAPRRLMAVGMTLYTSVSVSLASIIGNIVGGYVIDALGYRALFFVFATFPLMGILLFLGLKKRVFVSH